MFVSELLPFFAPSFCICAYDSETTETVWEGCNLFVMALTTSSSRFLKVVRIFWSPSFISVTTILLEYVWIVLFTSRSTSHWIRSSYSFEFLEAASRFFKCSSYDWCILLICFTRSSISFFSKVNFWILLKALSNYCWIFLNSPYLLFRV